MAALEALVEVVLVFPHAGSWSARPHGDGFSLDLQREGEMAALRHWQLEGASGEILTDGDNEVFGLRVRNARPGPIELPDPAAVDPGEAILARMPWPAESVATVDAQDATTRYELRVGDAVASRWTRLGERAWLGTTADGSLAGVVVETARIEMQRVDVRLDSRPYEATHQSGFLMVRWRNPGDPAAMHESLRDDAWLALADDGTPWELSVHGVETGAPVPFDPCGRVSGELELWQEWPCEVTASRWADGGSAFAEVRFGAADADTWSRLENGVAVAASSSGELLRLVLPGVLEHERRPGMFGRRPADPFAGIAEQGTPELTVYGLAGEEGVLAGTTGSPGALQALSLLFGDRDPGPFVEVESSRERAELLEMKLALELASNEARANVPEDDLDAFAAEFDRIRPGEDELFGARLTPLTIRVDGRETELGVARRGAHWGGVARVGEIGILVLGFGRGPEGLELETVRDVSAAGRRLRELRPSPVPPPRDDELIAAGEIVDALMNAFQRQAGAPDVGGLFTSRVTSTRGGAGGYGRLLELHVMLRPISSYSASHDSSRRQDDGSVDVTFTVSHGPGANSHRLTVGDDCAGDPQPNPAAIRAGAPHTVALRLVREGGEWLIDTDLLALLEQRLGSVQELVRPLSQQG